MIAVQTNLILEKLGVDSMDAVRTKEWHYLPE
jgi:hypothetical protein